MATRLERLTVQQAEKALNNLQWTLNCVAFVCEERNHETGGALVQFALGEKATGFGDKWNTPLEPYPDPGSPMTFAMLAWHIRNRLLTAQAFYREVHDWVQAVTPTVVNNSCLAVGLDPDDLRGDYQAYGAYGTQISTALNSATTKADLLVISANIKANVPLLRLFRFPWTWGETWP